MTQRPIIHLPIIDPAKALAQARRVSLTPDPAAPPPVSIATRRTLFGTVGAMMLLTAVEAGVSKAAELDAELLACCAEALGIGRESDRLWDLCPDEDKNPAWDAYNTHTTATQDRWHELVRAASALPARTPEGLRAKAALALEATPQDVKDDPNPCDRLAMSIYADVLGRAGA